MSLSAIIQDLKKSFLHIDSDQMTFTPGQTYYLATDSETSDFSVVFEDDGATGYFYAILRHGTKPEILDTMMIYSVQDKDMVGKKMYISINWSKDNLKALLTLNNLPQAVFDFESKRGYCRKNFPTANKIWTDYNHKWDDNVLDFFYK